MRRREEDEIREVAGTRSLMDLMDYWDLVEPSKKEVWFFYLE